MSEIPEQTAEERLRQTIDLIGEDVALIELWAVALSCFTEPAARYDFGGHSNQDRARH